MSELRRYPDYKDSGVPWLGDIPSHWEVWKITHLIERIGSGTTPKTSNYNYYGEEGVLWVTTSELRETTILDTKKKLTEAALEDYSTLKIFPKNSVAIAMYGATIGRLGILGEEATFNQACCVYAESEKMNHKFLYYWLWYRRPILISLSNGGGQPNLNQDDLRKLKLSLPPLDEQQAIVNFLDNKLEHIDTLISKQQQLIEKLAEQRSAVITHAVTKGLDPNAPMKDSGVEWLGKIPEHWELTYNKYLFKFSRGLTITKADLIDEGIPCINYGEVHSKYGFEVDPNIHPLKCVPEGYAENFKYAVLKEGDFVFADTSEDYKGSGNFTHLNSKTLTMAGYHTVVMKQKHDHNHRYLAYMFDSKVFRTQIVNRVSGVKVFSITQGILKRTPAWLPPRTEQNNIVIYLDEQVNRIDRSSESAKDIIAKLQEYRAALITQAVTGKIDVRHLNQQAS